MPTRSLKFRLAEILQSKQPGTKLSAIAEDLGISDTTLRKYLRNEALTFERRVLERVCDYFEVGIDDLFELVPADFFPHDGRLTLLRAKAHVSADDYTMLGRLHHFFTHDDVRIEEDIADPDDIPSRIGTQNCLIVGSPRSNPAGEVALCTLFHADPMDTSQTNRRKLPLTMDVPAEWHGATALIQNPTREGLAKQCRLIVATSPEDFSTKETRATADFFVAEAFSKRQIDRGHDFGVVFVADHQFDVNHPAVRTYWVSGFTSIGTLASSMALESEVRSFSIDRPGQFVLAIIQATFSKPANSLRKTLQDYKIVHIIRGALPSPRVDSKRVAALDGEVVDESRWRRFQAIVRGIRGISSQKDLPALKSFYNKELRNLPEAYFAAVLSRLENSYAGIPSNRRVNSLEDLAQQSHRFIADPGVLSGD
jgi:transcriptional regulator with XRE-family HTH domain